MQCDTYSCRVEVAVSDWEEENANVDRLFNFEAELKDWV